MILSLIFMALAIAAYSCKELHAHGKLRWMSKDEYGFWGEDSYLRKYTDDLQEPPENWYYKLFNIAYKERWPTSATFTVLFTDGPHLLQAIMFLFLSFSFSIALELDNWKGYVLIWILIHMVHAVVYRFLQK